MSNIELNTKSIARIAAIQTVYQLNFAADMHDIDSILMRVISFYKDKEVKNDHELNKDLDLKLKPSISYLKELVKYTGDNLAVIDEIIINYLVNDKNLDNLPRLLLSILRVAICELKYFPEIPYKVVINEYTDIASDMLDGHETGFVNSLLDKYSLQQLEKTRS